MNIRKVALLCVQIHSWIPPVLDIKREQKSAPAQIEGRGAEVKISL